MGAMAIQARFPAFGGTYGLMLEVSSVQAGRAGERHALSASLAGAAGVPADGVDDRQPPSTDGGCRNN